ncbi:MAG: NTP transferase domain-containing protein [Candidatus Nitronauta litoralis]|uniref:NTP transferase domain-containing protein n=1 Tax=Candidatus Nitronauta litoralis TaxID=2705533 RepID=A0A7T0G0F2_9BACT|nr:MAG: NTP transferase domain-containing protein [Candidatus Nitronauta litoralis]
MDPLNDSQQFDAILLAGQGESSYKVLNQHKAFLRLEGRCLVTHVIDSLRQVPSVRSVYVVGQKDDLKKTLMNDGIDLETPRPITLLEQKENLYQNIWHTFLATLPEDHNKQPLESGPYRDRAVLIVPCDAPLITPHEIDHFIRHSDISRYDHILGITPESRLKPFYPCQGKPGIRMAYLHLKEDNYRINNLHLVKPLRIGHREYIQQMYQYRHQRNIRNVIPFAFKLFWKDQHKGYHYYLGLILSLLFSKLNCPQLVRFFKSWVPRNELEEWISKGLATRFKSLAVPYPGAALDIDNGPDFEAMKCRYQEWRTLLKQMEGDPVPEDGSQPEVKQKPSLAFPQLTKT